MATEDDSTEVERLAPAAYDELRALAASFLRHERPDHTLQPTALVHEVYLKLAAYGPIPGGRTHFLVLAANAMRQILVDHARARAAGKRSGSRRRVALSNAIPAGGMTLEDCVVIDDALRRLALEDPRAARIVELRVFAGLSIVEIAGELGLSDRWTREQWRHGRAWLRRALAEDAAAQ